MKLILLVVYIVNIHRNSALLKALDPETQKQGSSVLGLVCGY